MNFKKINLLVVGAHKDKGAYGGVVNFSNKLLENLSKANVTSHYFSFGKSPEWYKSKHKISKIRYRLNHLKKALDFCRLIKDNGINVVHFNSGFERNSLLRHGFFSLLAIICGCKTVYYIHGWREYLYIKIKSNFLFKRALFYQLNLQTKLIVSSKERVDKIVDLGISQTKITTSTTMTDVEDYFCKKITPYNKIKCLFCSHLIRQKGIYEFIYSAKKVLDKNPNVEFNIVGDGNEKSNLISLTKKMGIDSKINFLGYVSEKEKIDIFHKSHIFIFPSYREGFPTVVVEALASGLVIIATPVGGLVDVLESGKSGTLLNNLPPNASEISKSVLYYLENIALMHTISNYNMGKLSTRFDAQNVTKQLTNIYTEVLS